MGRRKKEIELQRNISGQPPRVRGGVLVVPGGLIKNLRGDSPEKSIDPAARKAIEDAAMNAVTEAELALGRVPEDVSRQRGLGYDIRSKNPETGDSYFLEVKGRAAGKNEVTLTRTELLASRQWPERWRLALVVVGEGGAKAPRYLTDHSFAEPDFEETSCIFQLNPLLEKAGEPV